MLSATKKWNWIHKPFVSSFMPEIFSFNSLNPPINRSVQLVNTWDTINVSMLSQAWDCSVQFSSVIIFIVPNPNNSCLTALIIVRLKPRNNTEKAPTIRWLPMCKYLAAVGRKTSPLNRTKLNEPGSVRGSHLLWLVGCEGRKIQKQTLLLWFSHITFWRWVSFNSLRLLII